MGKKPGAHSGVFAQDQLGGGQRLKGAQGDVAQIADRGRDHVKARRQRGGVKGAAKNCEAALLPIRCIFLRQNFFLRWHRLAFCLATF